MQARLD